MRGIFPLKLEVLAILKGWHKRFPALNWGAQKVERGGGGREKFQTHYFPIL